MKTVVITGGSEGLGKALAQALAPHNHVIILSRNATKLRQTAAECGCEWRACDVTNPQQVEKTMDEIAAKYGTIDVVVNNAGVIVNGELAQTSYQDIQKVITTNTLGALYVAKAALGHMQPQKQGLLVNVISQSGLNARSNRSVYNASKWAITGLTKALQQEAAAYGVRVVGFYPGAIETTLFANAGIQMSGPAISVDDAVEALLFILSTKRHVLISELGIKHYERLV